MRMSNALPTMTMLDMVQEIAREAFAAGDFAVALTAAEEALPYVQPRLGPVQAADPNAPDAAEIARDPDPETDG